MDKRCAMLAMMASVGSWGMSAMPTIRPTPAWQLDPRRGPGNGTGNNRQRMSKSRRRMRNRMARRSRRINRQRAKR